MNPEPKKIVFILEFAPGMTGSNASIALSGDVSDLELSYFLIQVDSWVKYKMNLGNWSDVPGTQKQ